LWGCWWIMDNVNPTNSVRCPCLSASARVESTRLNMAACTNATNSAGFAVPLAALANGLQGSWMSKCHSLVAGVQCPARMMLLSCVMVTFVAVNATSQPALQSCPIKSNSCVARTMCPWHAASGNAGQSRSASWVEWIWLHMVCGCSRFTCWSLAANRGGAREKMCCATRVCYGIEWCVSGRRTSWWWGCGV